MRFSTTFFNRNLRKDLSDNMNGRGENLDQDLWQNSSSNKNDKTDQVFRNSHAFWIGYGEGALYENCYSNKLTKM